MRLLPLVCASLTGILSTGAVSATVRAPSLLDCDAGDSVTVLEASPTASLAAARESRAYWLNRGLLKWPGATVADSYKLYYSSNGRLALTKGVLHGADGALALVAADGIPAAEAVRFKHVPDGVVLRVAGGDLARVPGLLRGQAWLVREDRRGTPVQTTNLQLPGALDDLYSGAAEAHDLGVGVESGRSRFKLWAPTARDVALCLYGSGNGKALTLAPMQREDATGIWSATQADDRSGQYYQYLVDVFVPGVGVVRNRVTDPYSLSLSADSRRSYIADLAAADL
ncbi:MAG: DUF3372 domain-containing protein, partial [Arenimonas sp.]